MNALSPSKTEAFSDIETVIAELARRTRMERDKLTFCNGGSERDFIESELKEFDGMATSLRAAMHVLTLGK